MAKLSIGVIYYGGWWGPIGDGMLVPPDSVITIEPNWENNGSEPVTGHLTLTGRMPSGEPFDVECITGQDSELQPGDSQVVTFADVWLNSEGIWPFEISLTIGGVDQGKQNFALVVSNTLTENQVRIPLEIQTSPMELQINETEVYGHVGAYIYRILPLPALIHVTFFSAGQSYVEIVDSDNKRWILGEKTLIEGDTTFDIDWDGRGVLEPRVWLEDSHITGIRLDWELPEDEQINLVYPGFNWAPIFLGGGVLAGTLFGIGTKKQRRV